jgi:hypothetical protein
MEPARGWKQQVLPGEVSLFANLFNLLPKQDCLEIPLGNTKIILQLVY